MAVIQSSGFASARTTFNPKMMSPIVAPLNFQEDGPVGGNRGKKHVIHAVMHVRDGADQDHVHQERHRLRTQNPALGSETSDDSWAAEAATAAAAGV